MLEDFYSSKMACFLPHTEVASILLFHANVCFTISSQVTDWYFCWKSNISGTCTMIWYQRRFMGGLYYSLFNVLRQGLDPVISLTLRSPGVISLLLWQECTLQPASFVLSHSLAVYLLSNHRQGTSLWVNSLTRCMWLLSIPCHEVLKSN